MAEAGAIQTGINLNDNFSGVLYSVIASVNMAISQMYEMQDAMSADIDTSSLNSARENLALATIAADDLGAAMKKVPAPQVDAPSLPEAPQWKIRSDIDIFDTSGAQRLESEMSALNDILGSVLTNQHRIYDQSLNMISLPDNASEDIGNVNQRIEELCQKFEGLQNADIELLGDRAAEQMNGQYEKIRASMNGIVNMQTQLNQAIESGDISGLNEGYSQLKNVIAQAEQQARTAKQTLDSLTDIQWTSNNDIEIFNGGGIERFQQEVQSADALMWQLNAAQREIEKTASKMTILPGAAKSDISAVGTKIQELNQKINRISSNPLNVMDASANAKMEKLREQLNRVNQQQDSLNQAMQNMDVSAANAEYLRLSQTISQTERYIRDNIDEQEAFNQEVDACNPHVNKVTSGFSGWQKAIIVANNAIGLIKNTLGQIGITDMSGAFGRIDTMNRFQKTVSVITGDANMAEAALAELKNTTVGTAYGLDVASKATQGFLTRGMSLGAATDQVRIWADAVSFYGEGTNEQLESVVDAIGKMYSKGKVEADQLDRLFDAGIGAAELYAQSVGESVSEVKEKLSAGEISAAQFIETVSQALDSGLSAGAAKEAGETWATVFANVQSAITRGWTNVITKLDNALASRGLPSTMEMVTMFGQKVEETLNSIANAMGFVVDGAMRVYDATSTVCGFIADNWSIIGPIIYGVAAALLFYKIVTGAVTIVQSIFNAALAACPLVWIVMLVIALIAVIMAVCSAIAKMTGVANSGFGVICGGVNVVIQFFKNLGLSVANIAFGIWNANCALTNNLKTAFHNAICSIQSWWYDLLSTCLTVVGKICAALNELPFVEFDYSGITNKAEDYAYKASQAAGNKEEYQSVSEAFDSGMSTFDAFQDGWVQDAFDAGASWGDGIVDRIKNFSLSDLLGQQDVSDLGALGAGADIGKRGLLSDTSLTGLSDLSSDVSDISSDTGNISDALDITEEDLKYLRDIAEQESVNRFTTAEIRIEQTNHNNISSDMDLDGIVSGLTDAVNEAAEISAEGVHV